MEKLEKPIWVKRVDSSLRDKAERTLYAKCERFRGMFRSHYYETTLYNDAQCTDVLCVLSWSTQRIMKSGVFRLFDRYRKFNHLFYIECLDNGVRRVTTDDVKYKYLYQE
jgi:hypothetical protein